MPSEDSMGCVKPDRAVTNLILASNLRNAMEEATAIAHLASVQSAQLSFPEYNPSFTPPEAPVPQNDSAKKDEDPRGTGGTTDRFSIQKLDASSSYHTDDHLNNSKNVAHLNQEKNPAPDGGYGWMIVFSVFMVHVILDGVTFSFSILFPAIVENFDASKGSASTVNSVLMGATFFSGPLASFLSKKFGHRNVGIIGGVIAFIGCFASAFSTQVWHMILAYGFLLGLGFGGIYLPAIVSVASWFEKKRATAMGLAVCGTGVGVYLFSTLITYFLEKYTFQDCLLLESAIILNVVIFAALLRPLESSQKKRQRARDLVSPVEMEPLTKAQSIAPDRKMVNDVKSSCLAKVWKTCTSFPVFHIWQYWVMLVVVFLCGVSGYVPLTFLADRAAKEGDIPQHDTQHLITIAGGCNLVGRLLAGFISDQKFCNRKLLYSTAYIISGLGTVFSIFCHNFISFALYGAVYGFTGGIFIALQSIILTDIVGIDNLSSAFGISLFVLGIAALIGPPMAGSMTDAQGGDYHLAFIVFGIIIGIGGVIFLVVPLTDHFASRRARKGQKLLQNSHQSPIKDSSSA